MELWVKIGTAIKDAAGVSAVAGALGAIDESYKLVQSVIVGSAKPPKPHPIAQYSPKNDTVTFEAQGMTVQITAADMERLDKENLELIQMYEDSMQQIFNRIKRLYPSRILPDGQIDVDVDRQLRNLARPMCEDFDNIINFLSEMGKYLHDHYRRYRQLCSQLRP